MRRPDASLAAALAGLLAAALQLAPVLGRGYVLLRDMEFVPHVPLDAQLLGVASVPRAVPSDLVVGLLSRAVPAAVLQDLILVAIIAVGSWGAGRLLRPSLPGAVAAAVLYGWNPYLTEHLLLGQWAILLGYAVLPWVAAAALDVRLGRPGAGRRLFLWAAVGAVGGASAELLTLLVALPVLLWPGSVRRLRSAGAALLGFAVLALPWALPALSQPAAALPDRVGAQVFATRPDTPLGSLGSLLTLGGVWNRDAVPPGRGQLLVSLLALAVTAVALWGIARLRRRWEPGGVHGLIAAGGLAVLLALWGTVPGARIWFDWLTAHSQALDLLRDGQRNLAPFVLLVAAGWGHAVSELARLRTRAVALAAVPVLLLPAAAWGVAGALAPVDWPKDWQVTAAAARRLASGPVVVLPWSSVRIYSWNARRPVTDPTFRWLARRVVGDTRFFVGKRSTPQEDPLARQVEPAVEGAEPLLPALARRGYAGALVQLDQPGAAAAARRLRGAPVVARTRTLELFAVPHRARASDPQAPVRLALAGDALTGLVIALAGISLLESRRRRDGKG